MEGAQSPSFSLEPLPSTVPPCPRWTRDFKCGDAACALRHPKQPSLEPSVVAAAAAAALVSPEDAFLHPGLNVLALWDMDT